MGRTMKGITDLVRGSKLKSGQSFDYIIVGGGTAGCVLANRLSEDGTKSVLLLEAGCNEYTNKNILVPFGVFKLPLSKFDWCDMSVPEPHLADRNIPFCTGKVLGGSSCTNNLLYHRGDSNDYKSWASILGDEEWSPENVLTYFKRSEDDSRGPSRYHGSGGELSVADARYQNPVSKAFLSACGENGYSANDDFNNWSRPQEGYGRYQVNAKNGNRCSAASAFLLPAIKRKNLTVLTNALVSRITFNESGVSGVDVAVDGVRQHISIVPAGEVVMCAGAINTPHILLMSGVGARSHLHQYGIQDVFDLPGVGKNLQDQPIAVVVYECIGGNEGVTLTSPSRNSGSSVANPKEMLEWMVSKTGPYSSTLSDHGAFFMTKEGMVSPDLLLKFSPTISDCPDGWGAPMKCPTSTISPGVSSPLSATPPSSDKKDSADLPPVVTPSPPPSKGIEKRSRPSQTAREGFTFQAIVARPLSAGSVELCSDSPTDRPAIRTGYFTDKLGVDMAVMRDGIRKARALAISDSFVKYTGEEIFPGAHVQSDEELDEYIRNTVHSSNSLAGSCKMGPRSDPMAVVGADLKVHGVKGLRIADASVMPKIPGGEVAAVTVMIAEKAAAFMGARAFIIS